MAAISMILMGMEMRNIVFSRLYRIKMFPVVEFRVWVRIRIPI